MARTSSLCERPLYPPPRRLVEWVNPTEAPKGHSLIDKVYHPTNHDQPMAGMDRRSG